MAVYFDQNYLVSTRPGVPLNEVRLVRIGDEDDTWAMSIAQARRVGHSLIDAAEAVEIAKQSPAPSPAGVPTTGAGAE